MSIVESAQLLGPNTSYYIPVFRYTYFTVYLIDNNNKGTHAIKNTYTGSLELLFIYPTYFS